MADALATTTTTTTVAHHALALRQARTAKETNHGTPPPVQIETPTQLETPTTTSARTWFQWTRGGDDTRHIPYHAIADYGDEEYTKWRTPSHEISHIFNLDAELTAWVHAVPEEDLARIIATTPSGLAADPATGCGFSFTPWQRISMAYYVAPFFGITSTVTVDAATLRAIAYGDMDSNQRRIPISCERSMLAATPRDVGIIDLPTAAGKTSWVASVGLMLLSGDSFRRLCLENDQKHAGVMFRGPSPPRVARLVVIAAAASTFDHFAVTVERLIPRMHDVDPSANIVLWKTMGKHHSTRHAYDWTASFSTNTIIVWVVPPSRLNALLREHPDITVPVCIVDEYTTDTPRERVSCDRSAIMKMIIPQATPQALMDATHGNRSLLKDTFQGTLLPPKHIVKFIRNRDFKAATLAANQLCMLDLMTMTPFRRRVREDLAQLVPEGLEITFVPSRRVTIASYIEQTTADLVPASLVNVVLSFLHPVRMDGASRQRVEQITVGEHVDPRGLVAVLEGLTSSSPLSDRGVIDRLKRRIAEFTEACPICMNDAAPDEIRIMGCCGYCLCSTCAHNGSLNDDRCAFCREPIRSRIPRVEVAAHGDDAPPPSSPPSSLPPPTAGVRLDVYPDAPVADYAPAALRSNTQVENLTLTLHHVTATLGCKRILIIIERARHGGDIDAHMSLDTLASRTRVDISRVDPLLVGKGTAFARIKARFDSPDPAAMAMLCYGIHPSFLVGTDLAHADCLVTVGDIPETILTQALGRVFRPRVGRDASRPVHMFKIFSPSSMHVRP